MQRPARARPLAALVLAVCCGLLGVAAMLSPDPSGLGSHRQLGLGTCSVVAITGYPCPTCGMTTAFAHAVRGQILASFHAQPAGLAMVAATVLVAILAGHALITARVWTVNFYRVSPVWIPLALAVVVVLGWAYKIVAGTMVGRFPLHAL